MSPLIFALLGFGVIAELVLAAVLTRTYWQPLLPWPDAGFTLAGDARSGGQGGATTLDTPASGLGAGFAGRAGREAPAADVPGPPDIRLAVILIRDVLVALDHANETNNYTVLRDIASFEFQRANTAAGLSRAFADIRGRNVDMMPALSVNPLLEHEPLVDEDGDLVLRGFFPTAPERLDFEMAFSWSGTRWRLFAVTVDTTPNADNSDIPGAEDWPELRARPPVASPTAAGVPEMPSGFTMVALVRDTIAAVNQANRTGNYAVLREIASPGFQTGNPHVRLSAVFANLRELDVDLAPVLVIDPELYRPPAIDDRGLLRLTGYFPSRPEQVNYDLAYQFVGDAWRLFGVVVNLGAPPPQPASAPDAEAAGRPAGE